MSDHTTTTNPDPSCPHCGRLHTGRCPQVKAIEYYPDGTVKRVEYITSEPLKPIPITPFRPPFETTSGSVDCEANDFWMWS